MKRLTTGCARWMFAILTPLCIAPAVAAQQTPGPVEPTDQESEEPSANYGKTPDTAIPYRNFRQPYKRFFQKRMEFLGAGRDKEPEALPESVRIGFFAPLGAAPDSDLGEEMLEGTKLAFEQANADGGYQGIPFELVVRPDLALWGASSNVLVAFKYEDDVLAVIGAIDPANTHIALRVVLKTQMFIVNTGDTDPTLTETNIPWILRCMADDRQQGYALAHHVFHECGIKRVVAFRANNHYGRVGIAEFRDAARRLKNPLGVELRWAPGDRDFSAQLDVIAETEPEAIILWGNAADGAAVVREIRRRNMPLRIFGCDRLASREFLDAAGSAAEGVVAAATYNPTRDDPRLKAFEEAYGLRFEKPPGTFAAHAYDGANMLIGAIRKAGLNRARIRDAMYEYTHFDGVTGPIIFDTTLNDIGPVYLATVVEGKLLYRRVDFNNVVRPADTRVPDSGTAATVRERSSEAGRAARPYRTMVDAAPVARSPDRRVPEPGTSLRLGCFLPLDEGGQAMVDGVRSALAKDAARRPDEDPIELVVRDARGAWGESTRNLVDLIVEDGVIAVIGSTERRGTHLAQMLAAKVHVPVLTPCGSDPSITAVPMPWIFCLARNGKRPPADLRGPELVGPAADNNPLFEIGHDAAALVAERIRAGARTRLALRDALAGGDWHDGRTGVFRFDRLGNRLDRESSPVPVADGRPRD